jgi:hypothetical protein
MVTMTSLRESGFPALIAAWSAFALLVCPNAAKADPGVIPGITVMTIVSWSGTDCIPIRTPDGQRDLCDIYQQPKSEAVVVHGKGIGDLVGADPVMGRADWVSCDVYLNGNLTFRDSATAGDGSDVNCLIVLR